MIALGGGWRPGFGLELGAPSAACTVAELFTTSAPLAVLRPIVNGTRG